MGKLPYNHYGMDNLLTMSLMSLSTSRDFGLNIGFIIAHTVVVEDGENKDVEPSKMSTSKNP
jgi:hypothetical protein